MSFDPYYEWLGIPPQEQPPTHYRLLGIAAFEPDATVIANAADRQTLYLRGLQNGQRGAATQPLLNAVANARIVLLDLAKKAEYDAQLTWQHSPRPPVVPALVELPPASPAPPVVRRRRSASPLLELAKIIAGGIAGLALGVIILRYVAGIDVTGLLPKTNQVPEPLVQNVSEPILVSGPPASAQHSKTPQPNPASSVERVTVAEPNTKSKSTDPPSALPNPASPAAEPESGVPPRRDVPGQVSGAKIKVARMRSELMEDGPDVPVALRGGLRFTWVDPPKAVNIDLGTLQFTVEETGWVYLAAEWNPRLSGGDWQREVMSKEKLQNAGWEHLGEFPGLKGEQLPVQMFRKICKAGESYSIRCSKYWPPYPFTPPLGAFNTAAQVPPASEQGKPQLNPIETRLPVPDDEAQKKATKIVREVFDEEHKQAKSPAERSLVARKMVLQAAGLKGDNTGKYVMLRIARDIATEAGDAPTAIMAIDMLAAEFQVPAIDLKATALARLVVVAPKSDEHRTLAQLGLKVTAEAVHSDEYEFAKSLAVSTLAAARKSRDASLIKQAVAMDGDVTNRALAYLAISAAKEKLASDPTDKAANLVVGRYLCFEKRKWKDGLALLALGSDEPLSVLATEDLSAPKLPAERYKLADDWWELGENGAEELKPAIKERAAYWYRAAVAGLTGLEKIKAEKRIIAAVQSSADAVKSDFSDAKGPTPKPANDFGYSKEWVNDSYKTTIRQSGGRWIETSNETKKTVLTYAELDRNEKYVELFCNERKHKMRLLKSGNAEFDGKGKWEWIANGHWVQPPR